jgi:chaperonin GroEL
LLFSAKALDRLNASNRDQQVGIEIGRRALEAATRQIVQNAGVEAPIVVSKLREKNDTNWGYDAAAGEFKDMIKAGIIDPTKVVRTVLQDAASVADLVITIEAVVAREPGPSALRSMCSRCFTISATQTSGPRASKVMSNGNISATWQRMP